MHISRLETAHLPPKLFLMYKKIWQKIFFGVKTNQVDNSRLLQTSNVWRQNVSCLPPFTTCFFLTCTYLDATDSSSLGLIFHWWHCQSGNRQDAANPLF